MQLERVNPRLWQTQSLLGRRWRSWLGLGLLLAGMGGSLVRADEAPPWLFRRRPGGGREELGNGRVCAIAPIPGDYLLSDRPKIIWQGNVGRVLVLSENQEEILWSHVPDANSNKAFGIAAPGVSLPPGQWYVLLLLDSSERVVYSEEFSIASQQQRELVASTGVEDPISSATQSLARVKALAEQGYWSDAMGILFSIPNSEQVVAEYRQSVLDRYCST